MFRYENFQYHTKPINKLIFSRINLLSQQECFAAALMDVSFKQMFTPGQNSGMKSGRRL
jgi:hypothetical protein